MSQSKAGRLHYNKSYRKIGWIDTNVNATSYKTVGGYINRLFMDEGNYNELVSRLEYQNPGIFDTPYAPALYGKRNDKQAILRFVTEHAKQVHKDMLKKNPHVTLEQVIKKAFNTRAYVSQDELIQNNMKTFLQRRANKEFADEVKKALGVKKIPYDKLTYNPETAIRNANGDIEYFKTYGFKGTKVAFVLSGSGNKESPYIYTLTAVENIVI